MPPAPMIPHPQQLATGVFPIFPPINQDLSMFTSLQAGGDGSEDNQGYTGLQQPTASFLGLPYDAVHEGMFVKAWWPVLRLTVWSLVVLE